MNQPLPEANKRAIRHAFPETAEQWIQQYPALLRRLLDQWQLEITGRAKGGLAINQVFFVVSASAEPLVLKIGHPHPEQKTEIQYLTHHGSSRVVGLRDAAPDDYAILLNRVQPGTQLRDEINNEDAIAGALQLHGELPRQLQAQDLQLPAYSKWLADAFTRYNGESTTFQEYIDRSTRYFAEFGEEPNSLLHGDLHHENILASDEFGWCAIDPKGVLGPAVLECGRFLHNFPDDEVAGTATVSDRVKMFERRCRLAAEVLPYDYEQLIKVTYIDATLSNCWSLNSGGQAKGLDSIAALHILSDRL